MKTRILATIGLLTAFSCHADSSLTIITGIDYSTGKYGASEKTETLYMPFGVKYETTEWTLRATIPYVETSGPSSVSGAGADRINLENGQSTRKRESGLGDVVLTASWSALQQGPWLVDLGTKVKLATADDSKGLGTGKNDVSVQTEVYRALDKHTLFGTLGYKKMGDPDGIDLRDPFYASLGWSFRASPASAVGLSYDYRQKILDSGAPVREVTGFVTHKLDTNWKLQGYLVSGYSNASPDFGGGVFVMYTH